MELTQCVHRAVRQTPDRPATIFGDRVRTWAQSADRIARLAAALQDLKVAPGDRVGLLALNSDIYHELLLAVPWADAVVTPVNTRWSVSEIAFSLTDSDTKVLYVDETFAPMVPQLREQAPCLTTVIGGAEVVDYLIDTHEPIPDARRGGQTLAGIFYTGGTTGHPKGVMLSHANMIVSALGSAAAGTFVEPGGRSLHTAPMFHLADIAAWTARNLVGGTHVMVPSFTPQGVAAAIERHEVTDVLLVPTMIQLLVDSGEAAAYDLSSLRHLVYGASPISDAVLDRAANRLPGTEFMQAYGMTELAPVATLLSPEAHHNARLCRSAGRAAPHAEVMVVDEQDHEVPRGTVGEIVVRGGNVMLGYWNRPEETETALRGGWMHTGDGGYMDENGYVYIVDRLKDMIVSGGENVYSAEVENALAKHPAVASCAVIGVPDEQWGERVHAVVVLVDGHEPSAEELRAHCKEHIASYKAPRSVEFVAELPVSGAGKILKRVLRSRHWEGRDRGVQ
ncbi:acyl-CoA synthetase [Kutzneria chonburiensis]|uniref:Long-chain fatty acid--CoA ligase n=1 Tax=Kutzneria chonburiensis TaxID=1483604 RepID=A0ABV6N180_9PSEU|nr:long-chain fatty acid--CoA ligase [Kutzneria chonburiensis]